MKQLHGPPGPSQLHGPPRPSTPLRTAALLAALAACKPVFFEVDDGPVEPDTTGDPHPDPDSDSDPNPTDDPTPPDPSNPPPPDCDNGGLDGDETDFDCGGSCPPCLPGQTCDSPADCVTGLCEFGKCLDLQCTSDEQCAIDTKEVPCALGQCDPSGVCTVVPAFEGEPCEDFDPCTDFATCAMGQCLGTPRACEELSGPCRQGFCNPQTGNCAAEFTPDGVLCEDGDMCTQGESCFQGQCIAGQPAPLLFDENFGMQQDWTLDMPWEIGPAKPSMCAQAGFDDPGFDFTGEGFLAGTLIGQCIPPDFPPACLTSPLIQAPPGPGPLVLRFASWLDVQTMPSVEMFDGVGGWIPLPVDLAAPEMGWLVHFVELPPIMLDLVQVRFCLAPEPLMGMFGGWSIDDVHIGPPECAP